MNLMTAVKRTLKRSFKSFRQVERDPRYIIVLLWAVPLYLITMIQALNKGWFDSMERPVFHFFNNLPHILSIPFYLITQFGSLGTLVLWAAAAWYLISRRAAITVVCGGGIAWLAARIAKAYVHRGRPQDLIHAVNLFENHLYTGYGFPSGHATFSAASATILYYQVKPRYRKYLLGLVLLVGISRMFLGAHLPLDVVGGWALGATVGSLVSLVAGSQPRTISVAAVKRVLKRAGLEPKHVRYLNLDARGSRPLLITLADGHELFGKIVGRQEYAADWLFKLYRFFRYKNLTAEEPYLNARRSVELESFAAMWAQKSGVRVAEVRGIHKIGNSWLLLQEQIAGRPLTDYQKIKQSSLEDVWKQVKLMHDGGLAHRDLRAANVMLDMHAKAWLIDFGFAEVAPSQLRKNMDIAELLMSMSLLAGHERTLSAARKVLGDDTLRHVMPYLQKSVFSGATTTALRHNKVALPDLRQELSRTLHIDEDVQPANIDRFNAKRLVTLVLLAVFTYVVLPQFKQFTGDLDRLRDASLGWLLIAIVFSILTYVAAGAVYVILTSVPLKLRQAALIQLASSFVSKVMPGGLGGTALNARYLTKSGLDASEASAVITTQNVIGVIMFIVPLAVLLFVAGRSVSELLHVHVAGIVLLLLMAGLLISGLAVAVSRKLRARLFDFVRNLLANLQGIASSPRSLVLAALASLAITLGYIGCLTMCLLAFHVHLSLTDIAIVYASAVIVKSVVPTPGGLGPVEVAMAAALLGYGVAVTPAYAAVILYRLATFWVPIPFSLLAYRYATKRRLI